MLNEFSSTLDKIKIYTSRLNESSSTPEKTLFFSGLNESSSTPENKLCLFLL